MRKFIIGLLIGLILGSLTVGIAAMSGTRTDREYEKFVEDTVGNTAVSIQFTQ